MSSVELAARRPTRAKGPPIETIHKNFLSLTINYYRSFISLIASNYVNEKTTEAARNARQPEPSLTLDQLLDVKGVADRATGEYLRNVVKIKPGAKNQVDFNFYFNFSIPTEGNFHKMIEKASSIAYDKPTRVLDLMRAHQNWGSMSPQSIDIIDEMLEDTFLSDYDDLAKAYITIEETDDDGYFASVQAKLTISLAGAVYSKFVDGDDFSPYLAFMMANNFLSSKANRSDKIYDPRKISSDMAVLQKKFGSARPRLNSQGFGIMPSGRPIFVPKELDDTKRFIDAADASIDEDGEFNLDSLVEKGYANSIIYVDWLNDILAYTTSHGRMQILNLRGVMELDSTSEKILLETPITDTDVSNYLQVITLSLADTDSLQSKKYLPNGFDNPDEIGLWGPGSLQARLTAMSGTRGANSNICVKHLAGLDLERDFPEDTDIKRFCTMFAAHAKMLASIRDPKRGGSSDNLQLPDKMKAMGIYHRLTGVEYYLYVLSSYTQKYMDDVHKEFNEEKQRQTTDIRQRKFTIPNIKIGKGGLTGFLPHQGRIGSSLVKSPRYAIMPVQTGGGKSILSIADAVWSIQDALNRGDTRFRSLISTKGRLVKGTITEINRISHGKLNAIPLRASTFRRMKRLYNLKSFADLAEWFKKLPPNTVFVNSYTDFASRSKIYDDLPSMPGFLNEGLIDSQYLRIIKLLNIKMIIGDESHLIKNPDSNRTKGAYSAFSNATHRHIMSGTILSNTAADLIGQAVAVSPAIFGNDPDVAEEKYGINRGIIRTDEEATVIKDRMRSVAGYHQATKDEWSYMLPNKADELVFANMTPLQEEFYDLLMREAALELLKKKDDKSSKSDDDDEDDEEADEDMTAEEAEEESFLAAARLSLSKVEQFLAAPDMNEQYVAWERKPQGADLVSPKVKLADSLIDKHLAKHAGDLKQNKIIVFGVNIAAIKHFVNHSKHGAKALVYYAGNDEVIRQFSTEENKTILIAAETALREGENLQMTSLIVRLQSVWAPGDHEQTVARMYRPDPRGKYNREAVDHFWTMIRRNNGNPSLDGVKMARLISKFVSNARITYEDRKEWKAFSREVDDLEMLRMNYELIFEAEREDVDPYFAGWKAFVGFENRLNNGMRLAKANELESMHQIDLVDKSTGKIIDINQFIALAMAEVEEAPMLPGSKRVFCPWSPNALPPDPDNYGFATLGNQEVREGDPVITEFGPGLVHSVGAGSVKVRLYGDRVVGLRRSLVCIPSEARKDDFAKIMRNPSAWAAESFPMYGETLPTVKASAGKAKTKVVEEEDDIEEDEDDLEEADVMVTIINGFPALVILDEIDGITTLDGWREIDPFISLTFRSWDYAKDFLETLDSKTYISPKTLQNLEDEIEEIKSGKHLKLSKPFDPNLVRDFFTAQRKKFGKKNGKPVVNPYWIAIEDSIRLAFDINSHEASVINWLKKAKSRPADGVVKVSSNDGMYANVFKSVTEARRDLSNLAKLADFDQKDVSRELSLLNDELKELMKPRRRPVR